VLTGSAEKKISATMARTGHERCLLPTLNKELPSLLRSASKGDEKPMIFKASKKIERETILLVQGKRIRGNWISWKRTEPLY
jgi:hypothetical protein